MQTGPRNQITDVPGLVVGQAADRGLATGVTVVTGPSPFTVGVHVMGGAPGTRETDLLAPRNLVDRVDALVLSGGSAFGLGAADGVAGALRARGRGFAAGPVRVPIVPAAILFDMGHGDPGWTDSPYPALGRAAFAAAGPGYCAGQPWRGHRRHRGQSERRRRIGFDPVGRMARRSGPWWPSTRSGSACHPDTGQFWAAPFERNAEFGAPRPASGCTPDQPPDQAGRSGRGHDHRRDRHRCHAGQGVDRASCHGGT